jgi:hypothetical protein
MKLSNFRYLARDSGYELGCVHETTGWGPWKRVKRREVFREPDSFFWRFLDTGEGTPGYTVDKMAIAAKAVEAFKNHTGISSIDTKD